MTPSPSRSDHYDLRTITLHWLTAFLVASLWGIGQTIDWFPKGLPRTFARSTHITAGVLLALVVCYRIVWRRSAGRPLPPADRGALRIVSSLTHRALYVLLCTTFVLGIANAWIRGDAVFGLFRIPSFAPDDRPLREAIENFHGLSANALVVLALLHASAGLLHHFLWKDGVLRRMLPLLRQR